VQLTVRVVCLRAGDLVDKVDDVGLQQAWNLVLDKLKYRAFKGRGGLAYVDISG